ncbi:unnamed protein product [Camellia sinensis]
MMHLTENSQPVWVDFMPTVDHSTKQEAEQNSTFQLKSGVISDDWETKETWIFTWMFCFANHGRPPGANVAAIADAATVRPEVIFTLRFQLGIFINMTEAQSHHGRSTYGEKDQQQKILLLCHQKGVLYMALVDLISVSLFLLTKGGNLVERRLHQRKVRCQCQQVP